MDPIAPLVQPNVISLDPVSEIYPGNVSDPNSLVHPAVVPNSVNEPKTIINEYYIADNIEYYPPRGIPTEDPIPRMERWVFSSKDEVRKCFTYRGQLSPMIRGQLESFFQDEARRLLPLSISESQKHIKNTNTSMEFPAPGLGFKCILKKAADFSQVNLSPRGGYSLKKQGKKQTRKKRKV
jgi:hypothetical protein